MLGIADYGAFCAAIIVFLALPGPGTFALLGSLARAGFRGGVAATLGLIAGDQVLLWLAVAGVSTLLAAHPLALGVIQYVGAAYLVVVGLRLLLCRSRLPAEAATERGREARRAFFVTLLNPKAIVFYMAFFPLFVDPARHHGLATFAVMAATIAALTFLYAAIVVLLTRRLADRLRASPRVTHAMERLAGVVLVGFGIKLALSR